MSSPASPAKGALDLRCFTYIDILQPQTAAFLATVSKGYHPLVGQAALLAQLPLNGQRSWALKYVPGDDSYTLSIDDQRVVAKATPSDDNCNQLALTAEGNFEGDEGSLHAFSLEADLLWTGDGLSGSFSYADAWTWDGRSGEVRLPDGEHEGLQQVAHGRSITGAGPGR